VKLLTITHFYESHGGGIERVAAQLNRQFARSGHAVVWAASDRDPPPGEPIRAASLRCFDPMERLTGLPMPIPGLSAVRAMARAVRDADAVVIHDSLYVTSILAAILARRNGKPVVLIQHISGIAFASRPLRLLMRLANLAVTGPMIHATDDLVFISDVVRRDLIGEPPRRAYKLLYNGVDAAIFHPRPQASASGIRRAHGLPVDGLLVIFVGRFVEKKGLSILQALARSRPELQFALAGAGPIRPENWGLPNVHSLGPREQEQLAELYCAANVLLLPSVGEGYPLVVQEAMASGLPVICGEGSARADPEAAKWLKGVEIDLSQAEASAQRCSRAIDAFRAHPPDVAAMAAYAARAYDWRRMAECVSEDLSTRIEAFQGASGGAHSGRQG
jgi:glycosyltransferase involved in cell wall biosynthesis